LALCRSPSWRLTCRCPRPATGTVCPQFGSTPRCARRCASLPGHITGFAIPRYVLDTPFGKVPLDGTYVLGRSGRHVLMRSTRGALWAEPNPLPEGEVRTFELPEVALPEGVATLPTGAPTFVPLPVVE
jgi:hypothetical protein